MITFQWLYPSVLLPCPLQVSQPPVATVWTLFKTTVLHTGSSPCRSSQKWMPRPAPPYKMDPLGASHPPTELVGLTTMPPPTSSTPHHQASRQPLDLQHRPRQTCYRALLSTTTRDCHYTHTHISPIPPTHNQLITTTKLLTSNNIIFNFLCFLSGFLMVGLGKLPQPLLQTLSECIILL